MQTLETRYDIHRYLNLSEGCKLAEVGVFAGGYSEYLLSSFSPSELHLIDSYESGTVIGSGDYNGNNFTQYKADELYESVKIKFKYDPEVKIHRTTSLKGLASFKAKYFDMIYIDADHTYEAVCKDLKSAYTKLKVGGWLAGHDYEINRSKCNYGWGCVKQAVDEFCDLKKLKISYLCNDGCTSFFIKKT